MSGRAGGVDGPGAMGLIGVVEATFQLEGRSSLVAAVRLSEGGRTQGVRVGDEALLEAPNGETSRVRITGVDLIARRDPNAARDLVALMLGERLNKAAVPIGSILRVSES